MNKQKELLLVRGCLKNERRAQEEIFSANYGKLLKICRHFCPSKEDAEDAVQEGFVEVFKRIPDYRGDSSLETWMTQIIINSAIRAHRKRKRQLVDLEEAGNIASENECNAHDLGLEELLQMLPEHCRPVVKLYAVEGYTHAEIGKMLGIKLPTSGKRMIKARALLSKFLNREDKR